MSGSRGVNGTGERRVSSLSRNVKVEYAKGCQAKFFEGCNATGERMTSLRFAALNRSVDLLLEWGFQRRSNANSKLDARLLLP